MRRHALVALAATISGLAAACALDATGILNGRSDADGGAAVDDGSAEGDAGTTVDDAGESTDAFTTVDATDADAACVADLANDAKNCGACNHDCQGAACTAGICQTTTLVTKSGSTPWGIAVTPALVYWTNYATYTAPSNGVWYAPKDSLDGGGTVRVSTENLNHPNRIVVDGTNVYWADYNNDPAYVLRCAIGQVCGTNWRLASNENLPDGITVDATKAYWARSASGEIASCPIAGCSSPSVVVASENQISAIVALAGASTKLFWTLRGTGGAVRTCTVGSNGTCTASAFAPSAQNDPDEIALFANVVYWANAGSGEIMSCPAAGCGAAAAPFVTGQPKLAGIAVDASGVYWVANSDSATAGAILTCPLTGCGAGPRTVTTGLNMPHGIALDAAFVYVTTAGDASIRRVVK